MIQFPDYVHAIHEDRRRSFEAAAGRAAMQTNQAGRWSIRRFRARRNRIRRPRASRVGGGALGAPGERPRAPPTTAKLTDWRHR
ncbi:MAG: hypothetical protein ACRD0C_04120 [Acidimicrobiia bacterium]